MSNAKQKFIDRTLKNAGYIGPLTGFKECASCGECCLMNACSCVPEEFSDLSVAGIEKLLDSGKYMITASYSPVEKRGIPIEAVPHLSAREVNTPQNGISITMIHSECAMLTPKGCKLSDEERPVQGLLLIPNGEKGCKCFVDTPTKLWRPYSTVLDQVVLKRTGKTTQELFEKELVPLAIKLKQKVQLAVVCNVPITQQESMAALAMSQLGVFYGLFGNEMGELMDDFIYRAPIKPVK